MPRSILHRLQLLADQHPTEALAAAGAFYRSLKGGENRDALAVMVSATEKLQAVPEHLRDAVLAVAEALNVQVEGEAS